MTLPTFELTGSAVQGSDVQHYLRASAVAPLPTRVKLGRIAPPEHCPVLRLVDYLPRKYSLPPLPVDWLSKAAASTARMYLNDTWGDCVIACMYHDVGIWTANESGIAAVGADQEVLNTYRIWNPGTADNGCVITYVLDYCRDHGISVGGVNHKIDGYVSVDWTNWDEVLVALFLFGTLPIGFLIPQAWLNSATWDVTNSPIAGGHCVPAAARLTPGGIRIASWGRTYDITQAAFTSRRWLSECYAPLSPDWYARASVAPNLIDAATLRADLATLGGGVIPDIGPGPTPIPPPPPGPAPVTTQVAILSTHARYRPGQYQFSGPGGVIGLKVLAGGGPLPANNYPVGAHGSMGADPEPPDGFDGLRDLLETLPLTPAQRAVIEAALGL